MKRGLLSETRVSEYLIREKHKLIGHHVQTPFCELDFLTLKENVVWLIEAKSSNSIGLNQKRRLSRTFIWLAEMLESKAFENALAGSNSMPVEVRSLLCVTHSNEIEEFEDFLS